MIFVLTWLVASLIMLLAYAVVGLIVNSILWMAIESRYQSVLRTAAWLGVLVTTAAGLAAIYTSPADSQQGVWIRLLYIHVPAAICALLAYALLLGATVREAIFPHSLAGTSAKALACIGGGFTILVLITGAIWGKAIWGVYWLWDDIRLTSSLALFSVYLVLIVLWRVIRDQSKTRVVTAIFAFLGILFLPPIHAAVFQKFLDWSSFEGMHGTNILPNASLISGVFLWRLGLMILDFFLVLFAFYLNLVRAGPSTENR